MYIDNTVAPASDHDCSKYCDGSINIVTSGELLCKLYSTQARGYQSVGAFVYLYIYMLQT